VAWRDGSLRESACRRETDDALPVTTTKLSWLMPERLWWTVDAGTIRDGTAPTRLAGLGLCAPTAHNYRSLVLSAHVESFRAAALDNLSM
jgi:hypothetical protein